MMTCLHCNQRLFFTSELIYWRVLSILANPYQALKKKHERTNKENYRKVKVINQSATIKTCLHFIRTTTRSQRLLAHRNPPANHHTNV